jgi:hypothetical protein
MIEHALLVKRCAELPPTNLWTSGTHLLVGSDRMRSRLGQFAVRTRVVCSSSVETRDELCVELCRTSSGLGVVKSMTRWKICFHKHIVIRVASSSSHPPKRPGGWCRAVAAPKAVSAAPESGSGRAYLPPAVGIHLRDPR